LYRIDPEDYVRNIDDLFKRNQHPEDALEMKRYMQGKFDFYGIKAPIRRKLVQDYMKKNQRPAYADLSAVVKKFWECPQREHQYFASELVEKYRSDFDREIIDLLEFMIVNKPWWDTVDMIAKKLVGHYFKLYPGQRDKYIDKWISYDELWLQRTALLFQLGYKEETDVNLLFYIIQNLQDNEEFFIQKAIGWALRDYSKLEPEVVREFVDGRELSKFAYKEATKRL